MDNKKPHKTKKVVSKVLIWGLPQGEGNIILLYIYMLLHQNASTAVALHWW